MWKMRLAAVGGLFLLPVTLTAGSEVTIKQTEELKGAMAISPDFSQYAFRVQTKTTRKGYGLTIFYDYGVKIRQTDSGKDDLRTLDWDQDWGNPSGACFSTDGKKLAITCGG